jgi:peptide/nickel transport system permease protein
MLQEAYLRRYILNRILLGIITLIGVSIIVFLASRLAGDPAYLYAPAGSSQEIINRYHVILGLDKPLPVQYFIFIKNAIKGDFGTSIDYRLPVIEIIVGRLPATLELGLISFLVGNVVGLFLGIVAARRRGTVWDWGVTGFSLLGQALPGFWLAVMLMIIFAVDLHWLPTSGIGGIKHLILPVVSTSWFNTAFVLRITRSAMLDVIDSDYVKMARIKGNPERIVIWKHALRNALIPVVTLAGMQLAMVIGGLAFTETVFNWPGIGRLMVTSIGTLDYPMIQGIAVITAAGVIFINLLVDLSLVVVDPRIKYE